MKTFSSSSSRSEKVDRRRNILMVEDNPGDVMLTCEALNEYGLPYRLFVAENGIQALQFLETTGKESSSEHPDLILLDLNLPIMDGRHLLRRIKSDDRYAKIPVIVLSGSDSGEDIDLTYDSQANCYVNKPAFVDDFHHMIQAIEAFWLGTKGSS